MPLAVGRMHICATRQGCTVRVGHPALNLEEGRGGCPVATTGQRGARVCSGSTRSAAPSAHRHQHQLRRRLTRPRQLRLASPHPIHKSRS